MSVTRFDLTLVAELDSLSDVAGCVDDSGNADAESVAEQTHACEVSGDLAKLVAAHGLNAVVIGLIAAAETVRDAVRDEKITPEDRTRAARLVNALIVTHDAVQS